MRNKKIFYFCRRGLETHFQFYYGWVEEARKRNLPIKLFTTVSFKEFFNIPSQLRRKEFIFIPCFKIFDKLVILIFFIFQFLKNKFTIVQLRKRSPKSFDSLKLFFKNFKYIIEREGDFEYERDYLIKHTYKNGFYINTLKGYELSIKSDRKELGNADHIICVSENLKNLYISRYKISEKKISALITGINSKQFTYNKEIRKKFRKKLGLNNEFVLIYIGNVFYSWQNISRTLKVYKIIKELKENTKLMIITRRIDKPIILDFIKKHNIAISEVILRFSIPNDKIPYYLNASDLGIILRENHPMNNVAAPGKFGEYACCGLPILTGVGIADFSQKLARTNYGIVLENIYDNQELLTKFNKFMVNYQNLNRSLISKWGVHNFSYNVYADTYITLLKTLLNE